MSKITVHAGDFKPGGSHYYSNLVGLNSMFMTAPKGAFGRQEPIKVDQIAEISVASEEAARRIGGIVGWGAVGVTIFGPVGLLAILLAKKHRDITFVAKLKDGRKMLATTDAGTYRKLAVATF